jgi:acetyl esterase/lipase
MRARFERFGTVSRATMQHKYPNLVFEDHAIGALAMESVRAVESPRCAILHLHGGAFVMGSPASYRNRAMRLSYRCHAEVFVPDYRLAPEHPYPAALDDALIAWQYTKALRRDAPIFITGDSSGGGLGLSLLLQLRQLGASMPNGAILLSPWTDLTISGASVERNRYRDLWLSRKHLECWARYYVAKADPRTPFLSPAYADLSGLPPLLVLVGEHEVLLDDAVRIGEAATRARIPTRVLVGKGMQHNWPLTLPWLCESRSAWDEMRLFVEGHCTNHPAGRALSAVGTEERCRPHSNSGTSLSLVLAGNTGIAEHPVPTRRQEDECRHFQEGREQ